MHTPGPWIAHVDDAGPGINPDICIDRLGYGIIADVPGGMIETRKANARLIAAAPDLLAACQLALERITLYESDGTTHTMEVLTTAINKATGQ